MVDSVVVDVEISVELVGALNIVVGVVGADGKIALFGASNESGLVAVIVAHTAVVTTGVGKSSNGCESERLVHL